MGKKNDSNKAHSDIKNPFYISESSMSIDDSIEEVNEGRDDNEEAFLSSLFYHCLCMAELIIIAIFFLEIPFRISTFWNDSHIIVFVIDIFTGLIPALCICVPLYVSMRREYHSFYNDIANVANRLLDYYDDQKDGFRLADTPLLFLERVASQYRPPVMVESEKRLIRKNSFGVVVVIPIICAVIPAVFSFVQSQEVSTFFQLFDTFRQHYGSIYIMISCFTMVGVIIRIRCLPTSYNRRSKAYKLVLCAYPFIIKELERRYNFFDNN